MSQELEHAQRLVEDVFLHCPSATYTVNDLVTQVHMTVDRSKKIRPAALQEAAESAAVAVGWWRTKPQRPDQHVIFYNPLNLRSYAMSRMRLEFANEHGVALRRMHALLDDPEARPTRWHCVQPGGAWWLHVEINKAWAAGNRISAAEMTIELGEAVTGARERLLYLNTLSGAAA